MNNLVNLVQSLQIFFQKDIEFNFEKKSYVAVVKGMINLCCSVLVESDSQPAKNYIRSPARQ